MSRLETKRPTASRSSAGPIMLVVGLLLGLLLGYGLSFLLGGSGGYATPADMSPTAQSFWVRMTADSLAVTGNTGQADVFMDLFTPEEQNRLLGQEIAAAQTEGDVARLERLSQLGQALQLSPALPGDPAATPGTTPAATDNNALAQLLMACGGALLLLLLLVGGGIILTRSRQASAPPPRDRAAMRSRRRDDAEDDLPALPSPEEGPEEGGEELEDIHYEPIVQEAAPPPPAPAAPAARSASWHVQDNASVTASRPSVAAALPALDSFQARYSYGDDEFDVQFSIEDPNTEFLGECGVGAAELLDSGSPNKVTAVELWLFDKADVRTVSKILLSEHAWHDPAIKSALASRGDLVPIREGAVIDVETKTLRVRAHVRELEYGSGGPSRHSFFERLAIDLTPQVKQ